MDTLLANSVLGIEGLTICEFIKSAIYVEYRGSRYKFEFLDGRLYGEKMIGNRCLTVLDENGLLLYEKVKDSLMVIMQKELDKKS